MKFDLRTSGLVTLALTIICVATACPPESDYRSALQPEVDREELRASRLDTIERITALGRSVDQYIADHPEIGTPKVATVAELLDILNDNNISTDGLQTDDAWGNAIVYENWYSTFPQNRADYALISVGNDDARDRFLVTEHIRDYRPGQDIIWRRLTGVLEGSGFTHGPTVIEEEYPQLIAKDAGSPTLRYEHNVEDILPKGN